MCWLVQSAQLWTYPTFLLVPLMVVAGIECFAGYHAWRFLLGLNGAVLGFVGGAMLAVLSGAAGLLFVGAFVGAVAGGYLFAGVVRFGSFVFAFGSVASLTLVLQQVIGVPADYVWPLAGVAGLAGAVAAVALCRPFMISMAAVAGAHQFVNAWSAYHLPYGSTSPPGKDAPAGPAVFIALAAIGLLVQFATSLRLQKSNRSPTGCPHQEMSEQLPLLVDEQPDRATVH